MGTLLLGLSFGSFWDCLYSPRSFISSERLTDSCLLHEVLSQSTQVSHMQHILTTPAACLDCSLAALQPESLQASVKHTK